MSDTHEVTSDGRDYADLRRRKPATGPNKCKYRGPKWYITGTGRDDFDPEPLLRRDDVVLLVSYHPHHFRHSHPAIDSP